MQKNELQPVLVQNPLDGKFYNIAPLFSVMVEFNENFQSIATHLDKISRMLPYLFKDDSWENNLVDDAIYDATRLYEAFNKIKPIDN